MCARDRPEDVWNFLVMIQTDILNESYIYSSNIVPVYVDYNDVAISHVIENNLHKQ